MERHRRYINLGCKHLSCNKKFSPIERDKSGSPQRHTFHYIYYNIIFYGCQAGSGSWVMAFKAKRITIRSLIIGVEDLGWGAHTPSFPSFPSFHTLPVFSISPLSQFPPALAIFSNLHSFPKFTLSFIFFNNL